VARVALEAGAIFFLAGKPFLFSCLGCLSGRCCSPNLRVRRRRAHCISARGRCGCGETGKGAGGRSVGTADSVAGVVLAAGRSARMMGTNKLLVPVKGLPAVAAVCGAALETSLDPIVVVLGHEAALVRQAVERSCRWDGERVEFVVNDRYREGRLSSVAAGLGALGKGTDAAMFLRGDQPWISSQFIRELLGLYATSGAGLCFPVHRGRKGSPTVVARSYFDRLLELKGDSGTLELWRELWDSAAKLEVDDPRCLQGVDTPEDLLGPLMD